MAPRQFAIISSYKLIGLTDAIQLLADPESDQYDVDEAIEELTAFAAWLGPQSLWLVDFEARRLEPVPAAENSKGATT
jgi:hypothetical protein